MSKIEDLIRQYCPNGCEWKRLGDLIRLNLVNVVTPSFKIKRNDYLNEGMVSIISQEAEYISGYWNVNDNRIVDDKYVCFGDHSEHLKYIDFPFVQGADGLKIMKCVSNTLNTKYLYYSLCNEYVRQNDYARHFSKLRETSIPVPPLPIQKEIVRILDKFTELEKELEKELEMRKKQYEWYRDELLTFGDDVERKKLGEVAPFSVERIDVLELDDENYVGVDNLLQDKHGKIVSTHIPVNGKCTKYNIGDILIGNIRPYLRKIWFADRCGGTNGDVLVFHNNLKDKVYDRYLYHILASEMFFLFDINNSKGAKMPRGDKKAILEYPIPVPSLQEQQRIVEILDTFDMLTTDLTKGLPAEIKMRRMQYEYYRDYLFGLLK